MNGDPNQTSTKLRNKAIEIIRSAKRPLASHEIETWIRTNDKELASLIGTKCSDYVRIILSVTQDNTIIKYKSLIPIQGVDKRSTFYGLSDVFYSTSEWSAITGKTQKVTKKAVTPKKLPKPIIKPFEKPIITFPSFDVSASTPLHEEFINVGNMFEDFNLETNWSTNNWMDPCFSDI